MRSEITSPMAVRSRGTRMGELAILKQNHPNPTNPSAAIR